jgi:hypothetical protein
MQYVLIDAHQRFLGTYKSDKSFAVGDTFDNHDAQSFTVIGLNWKQGGGNQGQSLTVIPTSAMKVAAAT